MSRQLRHTGGVIRASLLVLIVALGCGHPAPRAPSSTPAGSAAASTDDPSCPLLVPGTTVSVEDADQGIALVFVTTGDAADVRKRAATLADVNNAHHGKLADHGDHAAPGGMGAAFATASTAAASDVPGGSRVTFTAGSPDTVSALQSEVRMHAHHLSGASSCEMKM